MVTTKRYERTSGTKYEYHYSTPTGIVRTNKKVTKIGWKLVKRVLLNLDYSTIKAEDLLTPVRSEPVGGKMMTLAMFQVRYTVRVALPKWLQKLFKECVISDAFSYRMEGYRKVSVRHDEITSRLRTVLEKTLPKGCTISTNGYQPQAGFITLEITEDNTQYAHKSMLYYGKLLYATVRKFQKEILKGALSSGYVFPERLRWQRALLESL